MSEDLNDRAKALTERINYCAARALQMSMDESHPPIARDLLRAFAKEVHPNRIAYLRAALKNTEYRAWAEEGKDRHFENHTCEFNLENLLVYPPARWTFAFTYVVGCVRDANLCAHRYRWDKFVSVQPLGEGDAYSPTRVPICHLPNSRFRIGYEGRKKLKQALGRHRALVSYARKWTKERFLDEFHQPEQGHDGFYKDGKPFHKDKLVPHLAPERLLTLTGYTPEEFWREVKKPTTQIPRFPQLTLGL